MQRGRKIWRHRESERMAVGLLAVVLMAGAVRMGAGVARAQTGSAVRPPAEATTMEPPLPSTPGDPMRERMQVAAVEERHKRLVADSDRLVQLATELKAEVDKSTKNEMSVIAIKKATEIEKLAHDVKDRMKGE